MTIADQLSIAAGDTDTAERQLPAPSRTDGQTSGRSLRPNQNVGPDERTVSVAAGAILALLGIGRSDLTGAVIAAVGGGLIYRGATGHCSMYQAAGINTATQNTSQEEVASRGTHIAESYLISNKSPEELYTFWRNFENLPRFMTYLESVRVLDDRHSRWVAKAPAVAGGQITWDAEIIRDDPNTRIDWRSLAGSQVDNFGSIRFEKAHGDRGTKVTVQLDYLTPGGEVGRWVAKLFGKSPEREIKEDLRNFKRLMETGEILTVKGQSRGTCTGTGKRQTTN